MHIFESPTALSRVFFFVLFFCDAACFVNICWYTGCQASADSTRCRRRGSSGRFGREAVMGGNGFELAFVGRVAFL